MRQLVTCHMHSARRTAALRPEINEHVLRQAEVRPRQTLRAEQSHRGCRETLPLARHRQSQGDGTLWTKHAKSSFRENCTKAVHASELARIEQLLGHGTSCRQEAVPKQLQTCAAEKQAHCVRPSNLPSRQPRHRANGHAPSFQIEPAVIWKGVPCEKANAPTICWLILSDGVSVS